MSDEYQPISCDAYDYLEMACMHHEPLRIQLHGGGKIEATASNVHVKEHIEYLDVIADGQPQSIRLDAIRSISSTAKSPRFENIPISTKHPS